MNAVITIHGIKTKKEKSWQTDFASFYMQKCPKDKVLPFKYGYLFALASYWMAASSYLKIPSFFRKRIVKKFIKHLRIVQRKLPEYKISIIAHSFGGWIVEQALMEDPEVVINNIVFVHCPISSHVESTDFWLMIALNRVHCIYSWSSKEDKVIGKIAQKPFGQNGYWGFIRMDNDEDREKPHHKPYPIELYNVVTKEDHGGVLRSLDKYGATLIEELTK